MAPGPTRSAGTQAPSTAAESATVTFVRVTLPVFVTTMLYVSVLPTTYGPVDVSTLSIVNDRVRREGDHHRVFTRRIPGPCRRHHPSPTRIREAASVHVRLRHHMARRTRHRRQWRQVGPVRRAHRHPASQPSLPPSRSSGSHYPCSLPQCYTSACYPPHTDPSTSQPCRSSTIGFGVKVITTVSSQAGSPAVQTSSSVTDPVFVKLPASTSVCVTTWLAAHVIVANGARSDPFGGLHRHPAPQPSLPPSRSSGSHYPCSLPQCYTSACYPPHTDRSTSQPCRSSMLAVRGEGHDHCLRTLSRIRRSRADIIIRHGGYVHKAASIHVRLQSPCSCPHTSSSPTAPGPTRSQVWLASVSSAESLTVTFVRVTLPVFVIVTV